MYKCGICGSTEVEVKAWILPNIMKISEFNLLDDEAWCKECEDIVTLKFEKDEED
jgi:hypothetical protein